MIGAPSPKISLEATLRDPQFLPHSISVISQLLSGLSGQFRLSKAVVDLVEQRLPSHRGSIRTHVNLLREHCSMQISSQLAISDFVLKPFFMLVSCLLWPFRIIWSTMRDVISHRLASKTKHDDENVQLIPERVAMAGAWHVLASAQSGVC